MKTVERMTQVIANRLATLGNQIETLIPTAICSVGDTRADDSLQIYASFLKTVQSESLDLCVLLKRIATGAVISADLVRGGSGEVLTEMPPITLLDRCRESEFDRIANYIGEYISAQSETIVQDLS